MLDFMDYIQLAFAEGTNWNRDNSYSSLTATTQCETLDDTQLTNIQVCLILDEQHSSTSLPPSVSVSTSPPSQPLISQPATHSAQSV